MSNDLVQRLRSLGKDQHFSFDYSPEATAMIEAADRIEALEKQVDDVTWTALSKRIEALEAALRGIAEQGDWASRNMARRALEGKDG